MSEISRFTARTVTLAKNAVGDRDESAVPAGGSGFTDHAPVSLHCLRIYLEKSYRVTLDLPSEMPGILEERGLTRLPDFTALRHSFASIPIQRWRAFLWRSIEKRTDQVAVDATGFDCDQPSRHYAQRAHYRVRSSK